MGRLKDELLDPWGGVIAGVAGGLAWAVAPLGALALPVGLGVAAVVYGVKVGAGVLTRGGGADAPAAPAALPPPRPPRRGSPAEQWLRRAEQAERSLGELIGSPDSATTRDQLLPVRDGAAEAVATVRRLAGQVTSVEDYAERVRPDQLEAERARLAAAVAAAGSERVRAERQRSLDSVTESLAVAHRLAGSRDELLARMQSTTLTLEGLIARTAEVLAMSVSGSLDLSEGRLAGLAADLDGLRAGLAEADAVSRRVLDG